MPTLYVVIVWRSARLRVLSWLLRGHGYVSFDVALVRMAAWQCVLSPALSVVSESVHRSVQLSLAAVRSLVLSLGCEYCVGCDPMSCCCLLVLSDVNDVLIMLLLLFVDVLSL